MGSEINMSENLGTAMEISPVVVENCSAYRLAEENLGNCASNTEDHTFHMDASPGRDGLDTAVRGLDEDEDEDVEVDIIGNGASNTEDVAFYMDVSAGGRDQVIVGRGDDGDEDEDEDEEVDVVGNVSEERVVGRESQDMTESSSSSSFGCTDSECGTASAEALGDMEVESHFRDYNAPLTRLDGCNDLFRRKKKLSAHWRDFVRPVMWRCKWLELHIRELISQQSLYAGQLANNYKNKQCELERCPSEDHAMKSTPYLCENRSLKVMKRKKRKRVEDRADLASYMKHHAVFSYFVTKRSGPDSKLDDDNGLSGKTPSGADGFGVNEWSSLELKDSDTVESILSKIEAIQGHVRQLKLRMDKVTKENAEILVLSESAVSVPGVRTPLPDGIKSIDQPQIWVKREKIENETLTCNHPVKEERLSVQLITDSQLTLNGKATNVQHFSDPSSLCGMTSAQEQPNVKLRTCSKPTTPKNKQKRGRRKARTGRWNRRLSG